MKKLINILLIGGLVLLTVAIGTYIGIPTIAKNYIQKHDRELLGREVTLDKMRLNLLLTELSIDSLKLYEQDAKTTFVSFDRFEFRINLWALLAHKVSITKIKFEGLYTNIVQNKSQYNFDDLVKKFSSTEQDTTQKSSNWEIEIEHILLSRGSMNYRDQSLNATWKLRDLNLNIPRIYFSGQQTKAGLHLNISSGGSLNVETAYLMDKKFADLNIDLKKFALGDLLPYIKQDMNVGKIDGELNAKLRLKIPLEHLMQTIVSGEIKLNHFLLEDQKAQKWISCQHFVLDIAKVSPEKQDYVLNRILIDGLELPFTLYKEGTNFDQLARTNKSTKNDEQKANTDTVKSGDKSPIPNWFVNEFEVKNSSLLFSDKRLQKAFSYRIDNIRISASELSPKGKSPITLEASLEKAGKVLLNWDGPLTDISNADLKMRISNLQLNKLSPYMLEYFAYPISSGVLSFATRNKIRQNELNSKNNLDVYKLELGKKSTEVKPEFKAPIKLGLYILKDKDDKISIKLPVSGNIHSPEFSYKKIVIQTFINLMIKIAATPVNFVGNLINGNPDDLQEISFDPFSRNFDSHAYFQLENLSKILQAKPALILHLTQSINWNEVSQEMIRRDTVSEAKELKEKRIYTTIVKRMKERDSILSSDLTERFGLKNNQFIIRSLPSDSLLDQKVKNLYKITFDIQEAD